MAKEFSDAEEIFEDVDLDFDPSFPPTENRFVIIPKEQILDNPNSSVFTRAQVRARNKVLNVHKDFFILLFIFVKLNQKQSTMH